MTTTAPPAGSHFNADPVQAIDAAIADLFQNIEVLAADINEASDKKLTLKIHPGEVASFFRLARHQAAPDAPNWPLVVEVTRRDILDGLHEISVDSLGPLITGGRHGSDRAVESTATYTLPTYKTMYPAIEATILSKLTEPELGALQIYRAAKANTALVIGQP